MLKSEVAQKIAKKTTAICGYSISIINTDSIIIGSDNYLRLNTFHEGLKDVFEHKSYVAHNEADIKKNKFKNAKAGVALPIIQNDNVIGAVGIVGNPTKVIKYAQLVKNQVEMMIQQEAYFEVSKIKDEIFESFVQELIFGLNSSDKEHLNLLAQINNYNLNLPRLASVIEIKDITESRNLEEETFYLKEMNRILETIKSEFNSSQTFISKINGNKFVVFISADEFNEGDSIISNAIKKLNNVYTLINKTYKKDLFIGLGNVYNTIEGFKNSYEEAELTISFLKKFNEQVTIKHIEQLGTEIILQGIPENLKYKLLNNDKVQQLLTPKHIDLKKTFLAFCENNLNVSKTARALFIHRNTLLYRLKRINEITKVDINNFNDVINLYLLLKLETMYSINNA